MGFGTWDDDVVVIDEGVSKEEAEWQLVVEVEPVPVVIYLGVGADLDFWEGECVRLFGVWPRVWGRGNFVIVNGE